MILPANVTRSAYLAGLRHSHQRLVTLDILDLDHKPLRSLTGRLLDGQITFDVAADTTRVLTLTFLDPSRSLAFEPDDPSDAPLHRSRMLRVIDRRNIPVLGLCSVPVFTGPVWEFERDGAEVNITAHGKERLSLGSLGYGKTFAKGSKRTDAIKWLLSATGETRMAIPDLPARFAHDVHVHALDQPWKKAQHFAESMNRYLFYDGAGRCHLRPFGTQRVHTFDHEILTDPKVHRGGADVINEVRVRGGKPKGAKKRVAGTAVLKASHAQVVFRNAKRIRLVEKLDRPHARTKGECDAIAARVLRRKARMVTDFSADILPWPCLEEHDVVGLVTEEFGMVHVPARQWALPLGPAEFPMTLGSKRLTRSPRVRVS